MASIFPHWDVRCQLGQRHNAGHGYDIMLVFDSRMAETDVGSDGGALYFNRVGAISASTPIPCARALVQVIVMGNPSHRRPARNLVIYDYRFKRLEITAMAMGESFRRHTKRGFSSCCYPAIRNRPTTFWKSNFPASTLCGVRILSDLDVS